MTALYLKNMIRDICTHTENITEIVIHRNTTSTLYYSVMVDTYKSIMPYVGFVRASHNCPEEVHDREMWSCRRFETPWRSCDVTVVMYETHT